MNTKYQFLASKYRLPLEYVPLYNDDKKDLVGGNHDIAILLKDTYLKKIDDDTIFGQMQLLEMQLTELRENLKKEKDEKKQKSIESEIANKEKSYQIRENYLHEKTGNDYESLYSRTKELIDKEFLEYKKNQLKIIKKELEEYIRELDNKLNDLKEEWNLHSHLSLGNRDIERIEKELDEDREKAERQLINIRASINKLGEEK